MTLIEVIVSIVILGIIVVPLTAAAIGMWKNSSTAEEILDRNNDAQRIAIEWTRDVQNVAPDGVNPEGKECQPLTPPSRPETALITFNWTSKGVDEADPTSDIVDIDMASTWFASGVGTETTIIRRECVNGSVTVEKQLAKNIGEPGKQGIDIVHGPDKKANNVEPHTARSFCPLVNVDGAIIGNTCTIVVDGSWKYDLAVTRRVPEIAESSSLLQAPPAPRNFKASPRFQSILASYESPNLQPGQPEVTLYRVLARPAAGGPSVEAISGAGSDPMYTSVNGLENGAEYYVMVQAANSVGWGDWTEEIGPLTPLVTEPNAPSIVSITPGDQSITVRFTPPDNDGGSPITGWHVYAEIDEDLGEFSWVNENNGVVEPQAFSAAGGAAPTVTAVGGDFEATFTGLTNGNKYRLHVAGVNGVDQNSSPPKPPFILRAGEGHLSSPSDFGIPYGPPEAPGGVEANAANRNGDIDSPDVELRWNRPADQQMNGGELVGFRVRSYRGIDSTTPVDSEGLWVPAGEADCADEPLCQIATDFPINESNASTHYYRFTVATVTRSDDEVEVEGDESELSTVREPHRIPPGVADHVHPSTRPSTPAKPTLALSGNKVNVTFAPPFDGGEPIESLRVSTQTKATTPGATWTSPQTQTVTPTIGTNGTAQIDVPSPGRHLKVSIQAGNRGEWEAGTSASSFRYSDSSPESAELLIAGVPSAPPAPQLTRPSGSIGAELQVTLTAPSDTGGSAITAYDVTCEVSGYPQHTVKRRFPGIGTRAITGNPSTSTDSGQVRDGATYRCRSVAVNSIGNSPLSGTSNTAVGYGECTLKSHITHYIEDGQGARNGADSFQTADGRDGFIGIGRQDERRGLVNFPWNSNCEGQSKGMTTSAHVYWARLDLNVSTSRNREHELRPITQSWGTSTTWSSRPNTGGAIDAWCVNSTGWKELGVANVISAINSQVRGSSPYGFMTQDKTNCGTSVASDPAVYRGKNHANGPRVRTQFYTQGAWP